MNEKRIQASINATKTIRSTLLRNSALATGLIVGLTSTDASADYIQSLGMSDRSRALAGAVVSDSSSYDAFYTNPAGAAGFTNPIVGGGLSVLDTREVKFEDDTGRHDPISTLIKSDVALVPALGAYIPASAIASEEEAKSLDGNFVLGIGLGAPFAIVGEFDRSEGIHRFNSQTEELISVDLNPTVAYQANERLSLGGSLNIQAFEYFRVESRLDFGGLLGLDGSDDDTLTLQTDSNSWLPVPPNEDFRSDFDTVGATFGFEYQATDALRVGAAYRTKQTATYQGTATLRVDGGAAAAVPFDVELGHPGHVQVGASYDFQDAGVTLFGDVQWTQWSDTKGFGEPSTINTPNLLPADSGIPGAPPQGIQGLRIDYEADDTISLRLGVEWRPEQFGSLDVDGLSLRGGYWYDPSPFDDDNVDIITYSSDRHIFSLGAGWEGLADDGSGFFVDASAQFTKYENRNIDDLPIISPAGLGGDGLLETVGSGERFEYGGFITQFGVSVGYRF